MQMVGRTQDTTEPLTCNRHYCSINNAILQYMQSHAVNNIYVCQVGGCRFKLWQQTLRVTKYIVTKEKALPL